MVPLPPRNPLRYRELIKPVRNLDSGDEVIRAAGGRMTRLSSAPVVGAAAGVGDVAGRVRDVLARNDAFSERCIVHEEVRHWRATACSCCPRALAAPPPPCSRCSPAPRERSAATCHGRRRSSSTAGAPAWTSTSTWPAAGSPCSPSAARSWDRPQRTRRRDRRAHARRVVLHRRPRAAAGTRAAMVADPGTPARAARRWPRCARSPTTCCGVPRRPVPRRPAGTGPDRRHRPGDRATLSDEDISNDLLIFMLAGHDTTATALTYSLWALGHHQDVQDRVAAEAAEIGDRELTPADVPRLATPSRCCTRRCDCARPPPASDGWPRATSRSTDTGSRRAGSSPSGIYALHRDPNCGPTR